MFTNNLRWEICHVETSKLICEANLWTGFCMIKFLLKSRSERTMVLHLCGSGRYTTVLCFSIIGGDARVSAPSRSWGVEGFLERSLMWWLIIGLGLVFHIGTSEVKWRQKHTVALQKLNVRVNWLKIVNKTAWKQLNSSAIIQKWLLTNEVHATMIQWNLLKKHFE